MPDTSAQPDRAPAKNHHGGFLPLPLPPRLFVPVQNIEPAQFRTGRITRAQPLAEGSGFIPVAPATGNILAVREITHTTGQRTAALEIDVDPDQPDQPETPHLSSSGLSTQDSALSLSDLLDRLAAAGIWADRTTTPDLAAQLTAAIKRPIQNVVCNLLEADGAPLNSGLLVSGAADVVAGAAALARAMSARLQVVGAPDVLALIAPDLRRVRDTITTRLVELPNDYPQADPTILVYMLTGRRLRPGRLPIEQSILMLDGAAALAIGRALTENQPMLDVPLTVRERGRGGRVHLITATIGTPISFILEQLNIPVTGVTVRVGPVLRDVRVPIDCVISGGELRLDIGPSATAPNPDPCIRCGWCVAACPTRIHPAGLLEAAQQNDHDLADNYGLDACIECGICSYVCPSRLPLLSAIRGLKAPHA